MKEMKRWISCLLCAVLLVGLLPTMALAEGEEGTTEGTEDTSCTRAELAEKFYANAGLKALIDAAAQDGTEPNFTDIGPVEEGAEDPCTDEQRTAIKALAKAGVLNGTSPTTFNPSGTVTRAEAVVVLWRATGCKSNPNAVTVSYTDVNIGDWYAPAIHALTAAGIIQGTGGGSFNPNDKVTGQVVDALLTKCETSNFTGFGSGVTRLDMLVQTYETYKDSPLMENVDLNQSSAFTDINTCTAEEKNAIKFFEQLGVVQGYNPDNTGGVLMFYPYAAASNLQIAMFLKRCAELDAQSTSTVSVMEVDVPMLLTGEDPMQAAIEAAFDFLEAQGLDVTKAEANPNAPGLVDDLDSWSNAVKPAKPTFSLEAGTYISEQKVTITSEKNADIYYTTDGSDPTTASAEYSGELTISTTTTLKAIAVKNNLISEVAAASYTIGEPIIPTVPTAPTFNPVGGTYTSAQSVTIAAEEGAEIYYTTDSSDPTTNSGKYSGPITVGSTMTLKAIAVKDGQSSSISTAVYTISTGGSSSGGNASSGSSSSSSSSSSSGNKTEITTNPDGSTTTTVTKPDGTTTEITKNPDGSKEVVETAKDGTITTTVTNADGSQTQVVEQGNGITTTTSTDQQGNQTKVVERTDGSSETTIENKDGSGSITTISSSGQINAVVTVSSDTVMNTDGPVTLPMPSIPAAADKSSAPTVTVELPAHSSAKVEIPVEHVTAGTVAVLVKADGTEEVIKTSFTTANGVTVELGDGDTVKILDNSKSFDDVPGGYWGTEGVAFASSRELFNGTSDTTFAPDIAMDRAMIVTVLARFEGVDTSTGETWYEAGQKWAMETGISDGSNMDQSLTREQLAVMLWRYAGSPAVDGNVSAYLDGSTVSTWADSAVVWAVEKGLISGIGGNLLAPQSKASRAEVATILMRFVEAMYG